MANRLQIFRKWLQHQKSEGRMSHVQELEMWLKSFERYFTIANLPLTDDEIKQATLRDYSEELKVVADVVFRISQVGTLILSEERVSYVSFARYVENSLKESYLTDSYSTRAIQSNRPDQSLSILLEALLDVRTITQELSQLSKIPYGSFIGIGKIIGRELRKGAFMDFFLDKSYLPLFDRIENAQSLKVVRSIQIPEYKRSLATIILELFRVLRYLQYVTLQTQDAHALKRSLLVFSLVHADVKLLIRFMEDEYLKKEHPDKYFVHLIEGITYSLSMELQKVMQRELLGAASLQQYDLIFTKIENSHGILNNAIQQILCSIIQFFDPSAEGHGMFLDFITRKQQSLQLQEDLQDLLDYTKKFTVIGDLPQLPALVKTIENFRTGSMKYLMFKDWSEIDRFYHEISACKTSGNLAFSLHRFIPFLITLLKEVNKRVVLQNLSDLR